MHYRTQITSIAEHVACKDKRHLGQQRVDDDATFRGLLFGLALAIPIWIALYVAVIWIRGMK